MIRSIRFGILFIIFVLLTIPAHTQDPETTPQTIGNLTLLSARLYPTDLVGPSTSTNENEVATDDSLYYGDSTSVEIKLKIQPDDSSLRIQSGTDYRIILTSPENLVTRSLQGKTDRVISSNTATFTFILNDLPVGEYDSLKIQLCLDVNTQCLIESDNEAPALLEEATLEATLEATPDVTSQATLEATSEITLEATSEATEEPATDTSNVSSNYFYNFQPLSIDPPFSIKSNLPPEVNALFAALALFAGTMFTVAVAVEIIVDALRPLLGLKRDMSAGEALKQVREQLPSQLGELGVSTSSIGDLQSLTSILQTTTYQFTTWTQLANALKTGRLEQIALIIDQYLKDLSGNPDPKGDFLLDQIQTQVNTAVEELAKTFSYNQRQIENIIRKLDNTIGQIETNALTTSLDAYSTAYKAAVNAGVSTLDLPERYDFEASAIKYISEVANRVQYLVIMDMFYDWVKQKVVAATNITPDELGRIARADRVADELKSLNINKDQLQQLMVDALNVTRGFYLTAVKEVLNTVWAKRVAISSSLFAIIRYPIYVLLHNETRERLLDAYINAHYINKLTTQIRLATDRIKPPLRGIQENLTQLQESLDTWPPNLPGARQALRAAQAALNTTLKSPLKKLQEKLDRLSLADVKENPEDVQAALDVSSTNLSDAKQSLEGVNVALNETNISEARAALKEAIEYLDKIDLIDISDAKNALKGATKALDTLPPELTIAKQEVNKACDVINLLTSNLTLTESTQGWVTVILFSLLPMLAAFACITGTFLEMFLNPLLVRVTIDFSLVLVAAFFLVTILVYVRFDFDTFAYKDRKSALQATYLIVFGTIVLGMAWRVKVFVNPTSSVATLLIAAIIGLILLLVFKSTEAAQEKWAQNLRLFCATLFQGVVSTYLTVIALQIAEIFNRYLKPDETSTEQPVLDPVFVNWACVYGLIVLFYLGVSAIVVTRREQSPSRNLTTQTELGKVIVEFENHFRDDEVFRIRTIRILTIITGIILASVAHIDSAKLLRSALPAFADSITGYSIPVLRDIGITPGILLTGLAAAAGSAFWHDVLDRLRAAKDTLERTARSVRQAKELGENL